MTGREAHRGRAWTRRGLLAAGFGVLVGLGLLWMPRIRREEPRSADPLVGTLRRPSAAARLGDRVLAEHPGWRDAGALRHSLESGLDGQGSLVEQLARKLRQDFEAGRVVRVDGWVLGSTEARVYALAALVQ